MKLTRNRRTEGGKTIDDADEIDGLTRRRSGEAQAIGDSTMLKKTRRKETRNMTSTVMTQKSDGRKV